MLLVLMLLVLILIIPALAKGQVTYTWTGLGGNTEWATPENWSPVRTAPANNDVIPFNSSATVLNVPTQTIGYWLQGIQI
jgi:hypothetical protein